ncbi:MAG: hypothetical protein FJ010_00375 [Chloroflexi bacterium]|nr:hypothetical protein [Chloroflexota bacterium]
MSQARAYRGGYLIGFIVIGVVALRAVLEQQIQSVLLIGLYGLLYSTEPWLAGRRRGYRPVYFPMQIALIVALSALPPFSDINALLYVPLCIQALHAFERGAARAWIAALVLLLGATLLLGMGWWEGLALIFSYLAVGAFLISYDSLYSRTQADQAESQRLLADLQSAHAKLQDYAARAEELAAARERNRLARELHDSVSQAVFSITLTSQSARLLLERDPSRVPEQVERMQAMTGEALARLRSLIARLRPDSFPRNPD